MAAYQQQVSRSYNRNALVRTFQVGDWVLRKVFPNTQESNAGKLAPTLEGPYCITRVLGQGAYELTTRDGEVIPRSWNAMHLRLYFFQDTYRGAPK